MANGTTRIGNEAVRTAERLTTVFRVSVHAQLCVASAMLAAAEGRPFPVILTIPLAMVALAVSAPGRGVHLPNVLANVAGAIALFAAYWEFHAGNQEARLLSGAHLLVYLSWIVLFQDKQSGQYWWMCALSVLEVAVGSLLRQTGDYGAWMLGFSFLAVWTLSVFSVQRAYARHAASADAPDEDAVRPDRDRGLPRLREPGRAESGVHFDARSGVVGGRFVGGAFATTCAAVAVSFLVFLMFPRLWIGQESFGSRLAAAAERGPTLTGFTETVTLGGMGEILESSERVLEVRMFDQDTGEPVDVDAYAQRLGYDEPLYRGKVLDTYDDGEWRARRVRTPPAASRHEPVPGSIRQEYRLQPIGTDALFQMHPVVRVVVQLDHEDRGADLKITTTEFSTERRGALEDEPVEYVAYSLPRRRGLGHVLEASPWGQFWGWRERTRWFRHVRDDRLREFVAAEAERVAPGVVDGRRQSPAERAQRLLAYLRDSGEFGYTLKRATPPAGVDPVVHFLRDRRAGHCEYFASALALMLRTIDVPARVVTGFKGGDRNTLTGYHQVEQRHAHAWVEAFLNDRWVVLDPTPAAERRESVADNARELRTWTELRNYLSDQWDWYVRRMTLLKQRDQFYRPLQEAGADLLNAVRGDDASRAALKERIAMLVRSPERLLFSPVAFVGTLIVLGSLSLLYVGARRLVAWIRRRFGGARDGGGGDDRTIVPFYERFAEICRRLQLERRASQTPGEFAVQVGRTFDRRLVAAGLAGFPVELVGAFYHVRFGRLALPPDRQSELDRHLSAMERVLEEDDPPDAPVAAL